MLRSTLLIVLFAGVLTNCARPERALDRELDALLEMLPGTYAGQAPVALAPDGALQDVFHRIAPIEAPQFGNVVLYYQLSTGSADAAPSQMKIFVFDTAPDRASNRMSSYIIIDEDEKGHLDQEPDRWGTIDPDTLMSFPADCAFTWSPVDGGFKGEVLASDCVYPSRAFGGNIRPEMSYKIVGDLFEWDETLYKDDLSIIVTTGGALSARRL